MANITLQFETTDKKDLEQKASALQQGLKQLNMVQDAEAEVDERRFTGLELVGAISVGIAVVGKAKEFVVELRKLVPELKKLAKSLGFTNVTVHVGGRQVPVADLEGLSDEELQRAAQV